MGSLFELGLRWAWQGGLLSSWAALDLAGASLFKLGLRWAWQEAPFQVEAVLGLCF